MATVAPALSRREFETKLIEKAWKDPNFRKEVLRDPKGVFEKYAGRTLPGELNIYVHEEDVNTLHFSIPAPSSVAELSDEDLEKVAGGAGGMIPTLVVYSVTAGVTGIPIPLATFNPQE